MHPRYSQQVLRNFIVFEGVDGAGSTTQGQLLVKNLHRAGRKALLTTEPTSGPIGNLVRQVLRGRLGDWGNPEQTDRQLAHLFAADRFDHLYNTVDGVERQIQSGFTVVSTRYFFSSYAYNARNPEAFELVGRLNQEFPLPELVVHLRVPMEVSLQRLHKRDMRELYEREDELVRVAEAYERIFEPIRDRVLEFETQDSPEQTAKNVFEGVAKRLGLG
jgi:dTMP kinase